MDSPRRSALPLFVTLAGLLLSIGMGLSSESFYNDDDLVHLLYARWSLEHPEYLVDVWGRPGFTLLHALPAQWDWRLSRLLSATLTALTGWFAYRAARELRIPGASLVPAFLWLQPLTFTLAFNALTETVLAFYLATALFLHVKGWRTAAAFFLSLGVLTRHEAILFAGAYFVWALVARFPWRTWATLAWAPIAHHVLAYAWTGFLPLRIFLEPRPTTFYGSGSWFTMYLNLAPALGVTVLWLSACGVRAVWRRGPAGRFSIAVTVLYAAAQIVIYRYGLFASGGYPRFFVPLAPFVAILAAAGWSRGTRAVRTIDRERTTRLARRAASSFGAIGIAALLTLWIAAEVEIVASFENLRLPLRLVASSWIGALLIGMVLTLSVRAKQRVVGPTLIMTSVLLGAILQPIVSATNAPPGVHLCRPARWNEDHRSLLDACRWLRSSPLAGRKVHGTSPWVYEFLDRTREPYGVLSLAAARDWAVGEVLVWDDVHGPRQDLPLEAVLAESRFVERWPGNAIGRCRVFEIVEATQNIEARSR